MTDIKTYVIKGTLTVDAAKQQVQSHVDSIRQVQDWNYDNIVTAVSVVSDLKSVAKSLDAARKDLSKPFDEQIKAIKAEIDPTVKLADAVENEVKARVLDCGSDVPGAVIRHSKEVEVIDLRALVMAAATGNEDAFAALSVNSTVLNNLLKSRSEAFSVPGTQIVTKRVVAI